MKESPEDCVFCKILSGDYPISQIYADRHCVALMTTGPVNKGHALVIQREHLPYLEDLTPNLAAHIFRVDQKLAAALRSSDLPCDGVNLFVADGEAAEQEIFHFHLHGYPRTKDDGFGFSYDERHFQLPARPELNETAKQIARHMPEMIEMTPGAE